MPQNIKLKIKFTKIFYWNKQLTCFDGWNNLFISTSITSHLNLANSTLSKWLVELDSWLEWCKTLNFIKMMQEALFRLSLSHIFTQGAWGREKKQEYLKKNLMKSNKTRKRAIFFEIWKILEKNINRTLSLNLCAFEIFQIVFKKVILTKFEKPFHHLRLNSQTYRWCTKVENLSDGLLHIFFKIVGKESSMISKGFALLVFYKTFVRKFYNKFSEVYSHNPDHWTSLFVGYCCKLK